jgi:hypothetical protein
LLLLWSVLLEGSLLRHLLLLLWSVLLELRNVLELRSLLELRLLELRNLLELRLVVVSVRHLVSLDAGFLLSLFLVIVELEFVLNGLVSLKAFAYAYYFL